jgi:hypothetical protein
MKKCSLRIEAKVVEADPADTCIKDAWIVVESDHVPKTGELCDIRGCGIPKGGVRYEEVNKPARRGEPYSAVIFLPPYHIEHMLNDRHPWTTEQQSLAA